MRFAGTRRAVHVVAAPRGAPSCSAAWFRSSLNQRVFGVLRGALLAPHTRRCVMPLCWMVPPLPAVSGRCWSGVCCLPRRDGLTLRRARFRPPSRRWTGWSRLGSHPARPAGLYRCFVTSKNSTEKQASQLFSRSPPALQQRHNLYMHALCQLLSDGRSYVFIGTVWNRVSHRGCL